MFVEVDVCRSSWAGVVLRPSCVRVSALLERSPGRLHCKPPRTISTYFTPRTEGLKDWRTGIFNHLRDHLEAKQYKWRPSVLEWCTAEAEVMVCYCILSMYFHRQNSPPRIDPSLIQDRGIQQVVFLLHTDYREGEYYPVFLTFQYERNLFM